MPGEAGFDCELTVGGIVAGRAQDVDVEMSAGEGDVTTRGSGGWKEIIHLIKEWSSSVTNLWVPTNAAMMALQNAFFSGADIAVVFTDSAGYGFSGNAKVMSFKRGEPLNDVVTAEISLVGTGALARVVPTS
jgi:predicted secreted protein